MSVSYDEKNPIIPTHGAGRLHPMFKLPKFVGSHSKIPSSMPINVNVFPLFIWPDASYIKDVCLLHWNDFSCIRNNLQG